MNWLVKYFNIYLIFLTAFSVYFAELLYHMIWVGYQPFEMILAISIATAILAVMCFYKWQDVAHNFNKLVSHSVWQLLLHFIIYGLFGFLLWVLYFFYLDINSPTSGLLLFLMPLFAISILAVGLFILASIYYRPFRLKI